MEGAVSDIRWRSILDDETLTAEERRELLRRAILPAVAMIWQQDKNFDVLELPANIRREIRDAFTAPSSLLRPPNA